MRRRQLAVVLTLLISAAPAYAQLGDLAPGGDMHWRLAGVQAEVGVTFAMDPTFLAGRLPRGFRASTLGGMAAHGDSAARVVLAARADVGNHVLASLFVARLDSTVVEGEAAPARPNTIAVWWVPVEVIDTTRALPDPRARAGAQLVELGLWSADPRFGRRLGAVMPAATHAPLIATRDAGGTWRIRLALPAATIVGSCRPVGTPTPARYSLPQFSTVWAADSVPGAFVVYTYYGHRMQPCTGPWHASGDGALARALRSGVILGAEVLSGWRARAAAYSPR